MKAKNKRIAVITSISIGVAALAGASLASYATSDGYSTGKNALKKLLDNENYTADLKLELKSDDTTLCTMEMHELYDRNSDVKLNHTEKSTSNIFNEDENYEVNTWYQDNSNIEAFYSDSSEPYTNIYTPSLDANTAFDCMSHMNDNDKEKADKIIRFVELSVDTVVGDLKNNFTYIAGDENSSTYEISLDSIQIPELVNAGLSAIVSNITISDSDDPICTILANDPSIQNVNLKFTVDNEGRLTDGTGFMSLGNTEQDIELYMSFKMYDYGTTKPQRVDISTLPNVHEYDVCEY